MRAATKVVLAVVFLVGVVVGLSGTWTKTHLLDPEEFAVSTTRLMHEPEVQDRIVTLTGVRLAEHESVPPFLRDQVVRATRQALRDTFAADGFDRAWHESMVQSHGIQLRPDPPAVLTVESAPFLQLAIDNSRLLSGLGLEGPETVPIVVSDVDPRHFVGSVDRLARTVPLAFVLAVLCGLMLVVLQGRRQLGPSLALLGVLTVTASVLLALGLRIGSTELVRRTAPDDRELAALTESLVDGLVPTVDRLALPVGTAGAAVVVVGVLLAVVAARQNGSERNISGMA